MLRSSDFGSDWTHLRGGGAFEDASAGLSRFYGKVAPGATWIRDELVKPLVSMLIESGVPQLIVKKELGNITGAIIDALPASVAKLPVTEAVKKEAIKIADENKNKLIGDVFKNYVFKSAGPEKKQPKKKGKGFEVSQV